MGSRLLYYAGASTAAAAACLLKAFHQRPNFYSATVYLSHSNACILILTNLLLVMACSFMFGLQRLLYGPLRPIEIEQLSEKAWYAVLDTLLAMPSFREDVGGWLLTMFALLLAGKVWGWIAEGRVDILEQQPPANPRLFHARLASSLCLSVAFDMYMLKYCCDTVIKDPRPGMMVIFTFEFAILSVFSIFTMLRYALCVTDTQIVKIQTQAAIEAKKQEIREERAAARRAENPDTQRTAAETAAATDEPIEVDENEVDVPGWEDKRRYLFGLEVFTDFIKLMIYIFFFAVSITFNGLPMHIMRDVYMTFVSFSKRVSDYVAYRKATSGMNSRYADATVEEIRGDDCIICRESMVAWEQPANAQAQPAAGAGNQANTAPAAPRRRDEGLRAKKLPCGHILHLRCLKAWLERQQVCPTCRRPVVTPDPPPGDNGRAANQQRGAQGQQPRARRGAGRARMFNLGPVRIGFVNGPQDQVQNLIDQMQNNRAEGAVLAARPANLPGQANPPGQVQAQGPNHLGLREPYADDSDQARSNSTRSPPASLQIQLMEIEQRLAQEATNLLIDQRQLAVLRSMEGELARLRALRQASQPIMGTNGVPMVPHLPNQRPLLRVPPHSPSFAPMPQQEALHGSSSQQIHSGHEDLPAGLVIPQGWTCMPLHHVQGSGVGVNVGTAAVQQPLPATNNMAPNSEHHDERVATPVPGPVLQTEVQEGTTTGTVPIQPPTDDNGSPLFVPSVAQAPAAESSSREQSATAWTGGDWNFVDEASETSAPKQDLGTEASQEQTYTGKGKGRAVEVEDVPESETGIS